MKYQKKVRAVITIIATLLLGSSAYAQIPYRLPASHTSQHNDLIANQNRFKTTFTPDASVAASVKDREDLDEIYNTCWNSQSVNPYGNSVTIPESKKLDVSGFHMPVPGRVTSPFGWRARFGRMHKGVDMSLKVGDTVRAAFGGKVRLTKYEGGGYGYYVVVRHDNGMETVYGHLSRFLVKPNQRVEAGQAIALGGNTGRSTGPHLHFETRYMGLQINPADIIDFEGKTTHDDFFTFDKKKVQSALAGGHRTPSKKVVAKKTAPRKKRSRR